MISEKTTNKPVVLVATNNFGATHRYELQPDQGVFVGKSSNCGLQLHDDKLGDIHCRIGFEDGALRLQNWMSASGTLVNGKEIDCESEIGLDDLIKVGDHEIQVSLTGSADSAKATADAADSVFQTEPNAGFDEQAIEDLGDDDDLGGLDLQGIADDTDSLLEAPTREFLESEVAETTEAPPESETPQTIASTAEQLCETADVLEDAIADANHGLEVPLPADSESMDLDVDFFSFEEEETYDRETVALLQAEIEDLRAALAQRDAEQRIESEGDELVIHDSSSEASDQVLHRMEELIEEANRSDERAALLEEMLHAAEDATRSESEERAQLEAWVTDIEKRIGQREEEHAAELDALKLRLEESSDQQVRLQKQLRQAATSGSTAANQQYEEVIENLQAKNRELQETLDASQKKSVSLEKRLASTADQQENSIREEKAKLAKEQAKISRLRYELSSKLADIETAPKASNQADQETGQKIRALREHLREIHEEEKLEAKDTSLATRLSKMWKRVEY